MTCKAGHRIGLVATALLAACASGGARAESGLMEWQYSAGVPLMRKMAPEIPTWQFLVGPAVLLHPSFPGSGRTVLQPGITLDVRYKDRAFLSSGEGLGVNLVSTENFRAGVAANIELGRDQDDDDRLHGLGDLKPTAEFKAFAEFVLFPVVLRGDVRKAISGHRGLLTDFSVYLPVAGSEKFFVFVGPSVTVADATYMRHTFGVNALQAARSGYAAYDPGAGLRSAGFGINATWNVTDHWMLESSGSAEVLLGPAYESPIVRQRVGYSIALDVAYRF
jgi:outer membrane scaffolding protein for murein synthesis (MipA/OmpV family)